MEIPRVLAKKLYRLAMYPEWADLIDVCKIERERERDKLESEIDEKEATRSRERIRVMKEMIGLKENLQKLVDKTT